MRSVCCSVRVFGVSAKSMQCSYDDRGNSVPTILLMMQKRLYAEGGLKVCFELIIWIDVLIGSNALTVFSNTTYNNDSD